MEGGVIMKDTEAKDLVDVFSRSSVFNDEPPPQSFSVESEEEEWFVKTEVERELPADVLDYRKHFEGKEPSKKWRI